MGIDLEKMDLDYFLYIDLPFIIWNKQGGVSLQLFQFLEDQFFKRTNVSNKESPKFGGS